MSEKERPLCNPRAGSNDPELWDLDLAWYFHEFDSFCGLQSVGTSGVGQSQLCKPTREESADQRERTRNGFILTMVDHAPADFRSTSTTEADKAAVTAIDRGIFSKGRRIWKKLSRLPYSTQQMLKRAYEERSQRAGHDWGRKWLTDEQVRHAHREYLAND